MADLLWFKEKRSRTKSVTVASRHVFPSRVIGGEVSGNRGSARTVEVRAEFMLLCGVKGVNWKNELHLYICI